MQYSKARNQSKNHLADRRKQGVIKSITNNIPTRNHNLVQSIDNLNRVKESSNQLRRENTKELYREKRHQSKENKNFVPNSSFIIQPTSIVVKPNQYQKVDVTKNVHYSKEISNSTDNLNRDNKLTENDISSQLSSKNMQNYSRYYNDYNSYLSNQPSNALNKKQQQSYQSHIGLNTITTTLSNNENNNNAFSKPVSILKENIEVRYKNSSMNDLYQVQPQSQSVKPVQHRPRFVPPNPEELLKPTLRGIPFDLEVKDFDDYDWSPLLQQRSVSVVMNKNVEKLKNEVDDLERKLENLQSKIKHKENKMLGKSRENLLDGNLDDLVKEKQPHTNEESLSYHPSSRLVIREKKYSQYSTNVVPTKNHEYHLNKFSQSVLALSSHNSNSESSLPNQKLNKSKESLLIKPKKFQSPPTIVDETSTDTSTIIERKPHERTNKYGTVASIYDVPLPSDNDAVSEYSSFVNNVFNKYLLSLFSFFFF